LSFCVNLVPSVEKWSGQNLGYRFVVTVTNTVDLNAGDGRSFFVRCYVVRGFP